MTLFALCLKEGGKPNKVGNLCPGQFKAEREGSDRLVLS